MTTDCYCFTGFVNNLFSIIIWHTKCINNSTIYCTFQLTDQQFSTFSLLFLAFVNIPKGPFIYYVSKGLGGWPENENGQFWWRSVIHIFILTLWVSDVSKYVGVKKSPKLCWRNIRMIPKRISCCFSSLYYYASEYKWNYVCQVYGFYTSMRVFCRIFFALLEYFFGIRGIARLDF